MSRLPRDPRPPRNLRRDRDGNLMDIDEHRPVTITELVRDVRDGRRFRARCSETGAVCTQQVLLEVVQGSVMPSLPSPAGELPAMAGLAMAALSRAAEERR